jgi:2-methylisocitrate lyase-like PEP mutase family enzyme
LRSKEEEGVAGHLTGGDSRTSLRSLLLRQRPLLAPGCYDALSARLVDEAGFSAAYMTGFGSSAGRLGRPDVGLMTSEMVDNARRIVEAIDIPLIADADTGYGNPINVVRTVSEYERAGVAAIHLEDQVMPKKCGHMEGKQVIPAREMVEKLRAALDARHSADFLVIARTDAAAVEGLDAALERAHLYKEAGADMLFIEAPRSEEEIARIAEEFKETPLLFNYAEGGKTPPVDLARLAELEFAVVIYPISTLLAATAAMRSVLDRIRLDGTPRAVLHELPSFASFLDFIGLPEIRELESRYAVEEVQQ